MAGMFDIEGLSDAKSFSDISDSYSTVNEVVREGYSLIIQPEPMTNKKIHFIISSQSWVNIQFKELEGYDGKIEIDLDNSQGVAGVFDPIHSIIRGGKLSRPAEFKLETGTSCVITAKYTNGTCVVDYLTKDIFVSPIQLPLDVNIKVEFYNQTREEYNEGESFIISKIDRFPYLVPMSDLGGKLDVFLNIMNFIGADSRKDESPYLLPYDQYEDISGLGLYSLSAKGGGYKGGHSGGNLPWSAQLKILILMPLANQ